ncbi:hypothetical protein, partial [Halorubrum tibetense]
ALDSLSLDSCSLVTQASALNDKPASASTDNSVFIIFIFSCPSLFLLGRATSSARSSLELMKIYVQALGAF